MITAAVPATPARTRAVPPAPRRPGLPGTLRSELTKILSVRSTYWTLLAQAVASIGWAVLFCAGTVAHGAGPDFNAAQASLAGQVALGELIIVVLGALVITSEPARPDPGRRLRLRDRPRHPCGPLHQADAGIRSLAGIDVTRRVTSEANGAVHPPAKCGEVFSVMSGRAIASL